MYVHVCCMYIIEESPFSELSSQEEEGDVEESHSQDSDEKVRS